MHFLSRNFKCQLFLRCNSDFNFAVALKLSIFYYFQPWKYISGLDISNFDPFYLDINYAFTLKLTIFNYFLPGKCISELKIQFSTLFTIKSWQHRGFCLKFVDFQLFSSLKIHFLAWNCNPYREIPTSTWVSP